MTVSETPDEAYERLLRKTRLGEQIEELARFLDFERDRPGLGALLSRAQLHVLIDQLRELRARRLAMGREPDDQVNAATDMCCCGDGETDGDRLGRAMLRRLYDGCPLHLRPTVREKVDEAIRRVSDGGTGAEFLEAAREALGGGLELREGMGFCVGCGSRDCTCEPSGADPF